MAEVIKTIIHYGLHLLAPWLLACLWREHPRKLVYLLLLSTMLVDLDHLLARPIFVPDRMSIGFHPLHSYPAIACYALLALLPYRRLGLPWWLRVLAVGLLFHMFADWQDYVLWH